MSFTIIPIKRLVNAYIKENKVTVAKLSYAKISLINYWYSLLNSVEFLFYFTKFHQTKLNQQAPQPFTFGMPYSSQLSRLNLTFSISGMFSQNI